LDSDAAYFSILRVKKALRKLKAAVCSSSECVVCLVEQFAVIEAVCHFPKERSVEPQSISIDKPKVGHDMAILTIQTHTRSDRYARCLEYYHSKLMDWPSDLMRPATKQSILGKLLYNFI